MNLYEEYVIRMQRIMDIQRAVAVLHWDKEVNLPPGASMFRSRQIATLSSLAHEMFVDEKTGKLLHQLSNNGSLDTDQKRNIELTLRDYRKEVTLPPPFVERLAMAQSEAFTAWIKAREANDFTAFAPALAFLVELKREEAELRGYEDEPYNALLDIYEPALTGSEVESLFAEARKKIIPMIHAIREKPQPDTSFLYKHYARDKQWQFGLDILQQMGYDFDHGRQDLSVHPFTISFSPEDVRVTTRIDEHDFSNMLWSCIHEGGHALYEQGLPVSRYGLPLGSPASLAIHESQSRLWENHVGRGREFWRYQLPKLKAIFPQNLDGVSAEQFHMAINTVAPNLIRTEADELHYHLHVIIRFEIERDLMNSKIDVSDLSQTWNRKYKEYMAIDVPDDKQGVLQDVHWSHGGFGYFPTYSMGSFYAAQFFEKASWDIPDLADEIAQGRYSGLHLWLKENIYMHGRRHDPDDLCLKVTGTPPGISGFVKYAADKFEISIPETHTVE